jgi:hypothetical protein
MKKDNIEEYLHNDYLDQEHCSQIYGSVSIKGRSKGRLSKIYHAVSRIDPSYLIAHDFVELGIITRDNLERLIAIVDEEKGIRYDKKVLYYAKRILVGDF